MEAFWQFITGHMAELIFGLLAFAEIIVRLTPTKKDDSILNFIITIIDALFPNRRKNGGKFTLSSQEKEKDTGKRLH